MSWRLCTAGVALGLAVAAQAFVDIGKNATLIPLPEFITDPNEGETVGALPVVLITNEQQQIRSIIAPDVRYNPNTGVYPTFRFFDYPSSKEKLLLQGGKGTTIGEYFEASYTGEDLFGDWIDLRVRAVHENDPFERFYGFGNDSTGNSETNYTSDTSLLLGAIGLNLPYALQVGTQTRLRVARVRRGGVDSVAQLVGDSRFTGTPGLDGATIVGQRFALRYDTRDFSDIASEGALADVGVEVIDRALGSSASYVKYGFEGRWFLPVRRDKRVILAMQGVLDYIHGGQRAPFYERNRLGGVSSLRGFGSSRFVDNHRFFARGELRSNVWEPQFLVEQFKVRGHVEVAPFVEVGRVFHSSRTFLLEHPHVVGGVGFRAVVKPQVVGYIDLGSAGNSPSVFTGIDYPF